MNNKSRRDLRMAYIADESVLAEMKECKKLHQKKNGNIPLRTVSNYVYKNTGRKAAADKNTRKAE